MIGIVKLTQKGINAKSGFKYLRFDPMVVMNGHRLQYKKKDYTHNGERFFVRFESRDISRETMSAIILSNCQILTSIMPTKYERDGKIIRSVYLDKNGVPYPIVNRRANGRREFRFDEVACDQQSSIVLTCEIDEESCQIDPIQVMFEGVVERPEQDVIDALKEEYPRYYQYLTDSNINNCNIDDEVISQKTANRHHLDRFKMKYQKSMRADYKIDLDQFSHVDVIDLVNISEIQINVSGHMDTQPVFEISSNAVILRGTGLTPELGNQIEDLKYYYMLVTNCAYHRIHAKTSPTLVVDVDANSPEKELLFLKFNKEGLKMFLGRGTIKTY